MNRPTLAQLASGSQKPHFRTRGNWYARRVVRPAALLGTWLCVRLGVSAHAATAGAWLCGLAGCAALGCGGWLLGALLLQVWYYLDHVDGQLARWTRRESLDGVQFDYLMHHCLTLLVPLGVGWGAAEATSERLWLLAGLAWGVGALLLKLWDDACYKAFFQRLKRLHGELRVAGHAGQPPATTGGAGRSWLRALRTGLEMHVVVNALTLSGLVGLFSRDSARNLVAVWLIYGAVLAPALFVAQLVRGLRRQAAEQEFKRWFRLPPEATLRFEDGHWHVERPERPVGDCVHSNEPGA